MIQFNAGFDLPGHQARVDAPQSPQLIVEPLSPDQVRIAYALARAADPALQLRNWVRFARAFVPARPGRNAGILVARWQGRPYLNGLVCFRRDRDPRFNWVLTIDRCVAVDLLDARIVIDALMAELMRVARAKRCLAVRSVLPDSNGEVSQRLLAAGHERTGCMVVKPLEPAETRKTGSA